MGVRSLPQWGEVGGGFNLRRSEIAEDGEDCLFPQSLFEGLCHGDAAAHDYHVNIVRRAFEEDVAHVAAHHITFHLHLVGDGGNRVEYRLVQQLRQFGIGI